MTWWCSSGVTLRWRVLFVKVGEIAAVAASPFVASILSRLATLLLPARFACAVFMLIPLAPYVDCADHQCHHGPTIASSAIETTTATAYRMITAGIAAMAHLTSNITIDQKWTLMSVTTTSCFWSVMMVLLFTMLRSRGNRCTSTSASVCAAQNGFFRFVMGCPNEYGALMFASTNLDRLAFPFTVVIRFNLILPGRQFGQQERPLGRRVQP